MFEKSMEIAKQMKKQKDLDAKTLPVETRIEIAKECLTKTNDFNEYNEIKKTLDELIEERRMRKLGINKPSTVTEEELLKIQGTVNKEMAAAEKKYNELRKKANIVKEKYLEEIGPILNEIVSLENSCNFIEINIELPEKYDFKPFKISLENLSAQRSLLMIMANKNLRKRTV